MDIRETLKIFWRVDQQIGGNGRTGGTGQLRDWRLRGMKQRKGTVAEGRRGDNGQLRDLRMCSVRQGKEVVAAAERHPADKGKATDKEGAPDSCEISECVV